jgi:hypothetical protein
MCLDHSWRRGPPKQIENPLLLKCKLCSKQFVCERELCDKQGEYRFAVGGFICPYVRCIEEADETVKQRRRNLRRVPLEPVLVADEELSASGGEKEEDDEDEDEEDEDEEDDQAATATATATSASKPPPSVAGKDGDEEKRVMMTPLISSVSANPFAITAFHGSGLLGMGFNDPNKENTDPLLEFNSGHLRITVQRLVPASLQQPMIFRSANPYLCCFCGVWGNIQSADDLQRCNFAVPNDRTVVTACDECQVAACRCCNRRGKPLNMIVSVTLNDGLPPTIVVALDEQHIQNFVLGSLRHTTSSFKRISYEANFL